MSFSKVPGSPLVNFHSVGEGAVSPAGTEMGPQGLSYRLCGFGITLDLSVPQVPCLQNGDHKGISLIRLMREDSVRQSMQSV